MLKRNSGIGSIKSSLVLKKKIIISVTNDLTTDQRVDRMCTTLTGMGFEVLLVGRKLRSSLPIKPRIYRTKRMRLIFSAGPFFYAEFNKRLFLFLLFAKADLQVSNDLDTLLGNYLASRLRNRPLVHDNHEYFRGVPELNGRKFATKIWKAIEDRIFPKLKTVLAVNQSIASLYNKEYGNTIRVIRNVPFRKNAGSTLTKSGIGIPENTRVILYQGAVNVDRGLEEAILAMKFVKTEAILLIIGKGDVFDSLTLLAKEAGVANKVIFTGEVPLAELHGYTVLGDIGLSIEKDVSINYHYCLPNKFMDYIQAKIPVLVAELPEMKAIVEQYKIGTYITSHEPEILAMDFDNMLNDADFLAGCRKNLETAAADLCWENEEKEMIRIFQPYV